MSNYTNYSLSVEKGALGNIGKMTVVERKDHESYMDVMLFLVANGDDTKSDKSEQIVNVHFPTEAFEELKQYGVGDYIRIHFDRIDLAKGVNKAGEASLYISAKANNITLIRKAEKKVSDEPKQSKKSSWGK